MSSRITRAASIDPKSFGVIGDGKTVNTQAIQKTIDACSSNGGGVIEFAAGKYLTGAIILKDNVVLHLDAGAVLLGNPDVSDYQLLDGFIDATGQARGYALVGAADAKNVGIEGEGAIDGQGHDVLQHAKAGNLDRKPFLVRWVRCSGVVVHGIELRNSAAWTMHVFQSHDVDIANLKIDGHVASNNDGIDIDSSQSVSVKDCTIDTGDDAICLKTTSTQPCRKVKIEGCTLSSRCGAIKMGTESAGDFEDIVATHCHILNANLAGIKLLTVDGGKLHNVAISDITMDSGHVAIFVRLGARLKTYRPDDPKLDVGSLSDVTITNFKAKVASPGILISGIPDHNIENLTLQNIELSLPGKGTAQEAAATLDEKINAYPEIRMFGGSIPASALFARHVNGIKILNLKMTSDATDARPAVICDHCRDVEFSHWTLPAFEESPWLFRLIATNNVNLKNIKPDGKLAAFLRVEGKSSGDIHLDGGLQPISFGEGVASDAIQMK